MKQTICYLSGKISGLAEIEYLINFYDATGVILKLKLFKHSQIINPLEIKPLFGIKSYWCHMAADIYNELNAPMLRFKRIGSTAEAQELR